MKHIDPAIEVERIVTFLKNTFAKAGFANAVIGVSGGVDSAVSCALAVRALGANHMYPVLMPYGTLSTQGTLDAMTFVQGLSIPIGNIQRVDIKPAVDALAPLLGMVDGGRRGNIMARIRMVTLFDQAKRRQALVVGTENKSEHLLGYYTRFGDEASDIEPIREYYKTQVYDLAAYLNIPEAILTKKPSAGLFPEQTDESDFGFTYKDADEILVQWHEEHITKEEIVSSGIDKNTVDRVIARVGANAFKHGLPYVMK